VGVQVAVGGVVLVGVGAGVLVSVAVLVAVGSSADVAVGVQVAVGVVTDCTMIQSAQPGNCAVSLISLSAPRSAPKDAFHMTLSMPNDRVKKANAHSSR